jgi:hypothetical protein
MSARTLALITDLKKLCHTAVHTDVIEYFTNLKPQIVDTGRYMYLLYSSPLLPKTYQTSVCDTRKFLNELNETKLRRELRNWLSHYTLSQTAYAAAQLFGTASSALTRKHSWWKKHQVGQNTTDKQQHSLVDVPSDTFIFQVSVTVTTHTSSSACQPQVKSQCVW